VEWAGERGRRRVDVWWYMVWVAGYEPFSATCGVKDWPWRLLQEVTEESGNPPLQYCGKVMTV
jgi:hypothetical protein